MGKYADNHKGICFGFNAKSLFECVGGGGEVQYIDKLPTINFVDDDFLNKHVKNIFFKENKWSFEQEYRLHKMWESDASNNERCIHFPIESLVEIRLGKTCHKMRKKILNGLQNRNIQMQNNRMPLMRTAEILSV